MWGIHCQRTVTTQRANNKSQDYWEAYNSIFYKLPQLLLPFRKSVEAHGANQFKIRGVCVYGP